MAKLTRTATATATATATETAATDARDLVATATETAAETAKETKETKLNAIRALESVARAWLDAPPAGAPDAAALPAYIDDAARDYVNAVLARHGYALYAVDVSKPNAVADLRGLKKRTLIIDKEQKPELYFEPALYIAKAMYNRAPLLLAVDTTGKGRAPLFVGETNKQVLTAPRSNCNIGQFTSDVRGVAYALDLVAFVLDDLRPRAEKAESGPTKAALSAELIALRAANAAQIAALRESYNTLAAAGAASVILDTMRASIVCLGGDVD